MMKQPNRIKVGYKYFDVEFHATSHDLEPGYSGMCQHMKQKIIVTDSLSPAKQANTLLHETLHAICNEYEIFDDDNLEERAVTCLANGLCLLIQENPETIKWIIVNLKKENNEK